MIDSGAPIKLFTLDEVNALLPRVAELIGLMQGAKKRIMGLQARVDIEELTSSHSGRDQVRELLAQLRAETLVFRRAAKTLQDLGCELKDLERGLVDFYSMRGNEVVYLCWMLGELRVTWWHRLDAGVAGRRPL